VGADGAGLDDDVLTLTGDVVDEAERLTALVRAAAP
jgi:hypothetical protein